MQPREPTGLSSYFKVGQETKDRGESKAMPVFLGRTMTQNEAIGHDGERERKGQPEEKKKRLSLEALNWSDKGDIQVEMSAVHWDSGGETGERPGG